jgi:hypothetical protein
MSFQVDGIIAYTPEGKINCTIVDIENKQKYTIVQSSITETETISDEDIEKLISGSQSGESGDVGGQTDDSKRDGTVDASDASSVTKNPEQDTVAEQINAAIKNKNIPNVTKLEFVLQKSPETSAAAVVTGPVGVEETAAGLTGPDAVEGTAAVVTGPVGGLTGSGEE